ncbi:MAG: LysM peptidoglycan-binding domain-containing protein [Bacilli bacterium]|nr:LysM peptidoglycan-binding domain-containing protein [Bacilli bacterium]
MKKRKIYKDILAIILSQTVGLNLSGCMKQNDLNDALANKIINRTKQDIYGIELISDNLKKHGIDPDRCNILSTFDDYIVVNELVIDSYITKTGDTMNNLLARYKMRKEDFLAINEHYNFSNFEQNLKVNIYYYNVFNIEQPKDFKILKIQDGDNLISIGNNYNINYEEIIDLNQNIDNPDMIEVGMYIKIPISEKQNHQSKN